MVGVVRGCPLITLIWAITDPHPTSLVIVSNLLRGVVRARITIGSIQAPQLFNFQPLSCFSFDHLYLPLLNNRISSDLLFIFHKKFIKVIVVTFSSRQFLAQAVYFVHGLSYYSIGFYLSDVLAKKNIKTLLYFFINGKPFSVCPMLGYSLVITSQSGHHNFTRICT